MSHLLKETAEKFGDMRVTVSVHKPAQLLDVSSFTNVSLFAFVVLSQDKSTLLYLQQVSEMVK
jgi:hypothetical protein